LKLKADVLLSEPIPTVARTFRACGYSHSITKLFPYCRKQCLLYLRFWWTATTYDQENGRNSPESAASHAYGRPAVQQERQL